MCRVLGQIEDPPSLVVRREWGSPLAAKPDFASLLRCRWPPNTAFEPHQVGPASVLHAAQDLQGAWCCQTLSRTARPFSCGSARPVPGVVQEHMQGHG